MYSGYLRGCGSCRKFYSMIMRDIVYKKRRKTNHKSFFCQSISNQQCVQTPSKLYSSSATIASDSGYSSDKTTHFGYQTVSEKEKHENGKCNIGS